MRAGWPHGRNKMRSHWRSKTEMLFSKWKVSFGKVLVDRINMSPFRILTNIRAIQWAQRQAAEKEVGTDPQTRLCVTKTVLGTQSTFFYHVQRWPLVARVVKLTVVKLHKVYSYQREGSCFLLKAEIAGVFIKVTFMLSHQCPHFWVSENLFPNVRSSKGKEEIRRWKKVERIFLDSP